MEEVKIGRSVGIPTVGLKSVRMPIVGNRADFDNGDFKMMKDLKSHMLGWYDPKLQGCTNESLTKNPMLKDLSGNNHPLKLKNFTFGGLSGMGSYGTNLTKWVGAEGSIISYINKKPNVLEVSFTEKANRYNINVVRLDYNGVATNTYFKAKLNFDGYFEMYLKLEGVAKNKILSFKKDKIVEVYEEHLLSIRFIPADIVNGVSTVETIYKLEILPSYPNSLVFNGTVPQYPVNNTNTTIGNKCTAIGFNKFLVTGVNTENLLKQEIKGQAGQPLHVSFPSYIIRVTGLKTIVSNTAIKFSNYDNVNGNFLPYNINSDGTYIIPAIDYTVEPTDENFVITANPFRVISTGTADADSITLEFLPNYPAPTTKEYGVIPSLTQGAKCMMMDFVPMLYEQETRCAYTQRMLTSGNNYAILFSTVYNGLAYNHANNNGSYINSVKNNRYTILDLLQKRQVISVNTKILEDLPNGIVICSNENLKSRFYTMALNSLILFDKELTEEEMKFVMKKFMKYEPDDYMKSLMQNTPTSSLALDDEDFEELVDGWKFSNEDDNEYDNTEDSDIDS